MIDLIKNFDFHYNYAQKLSDISKEESYLSYKTPQKILEINKKNRSVVLIDTISKRLVGCFLLSDYPPTKY